VTWGGGQPNPQSPFLACPERGLFLCFLDLSVDKSLLGVVHKPFDQVVLWKNGELDPYGLVLFAFVYY
jgi:hypothetical protein